MPVKIEVTKQKGLVQYLAEEPFDALLGVSGTIKTNGSIVANQDQTKTIHKPTITPDNSQTAPGLGPQPIAFGSVMGLEFDNPATDSAYRIMKIDDTFSGDGSGNNASFHIHWTKSGDVNENGNTVRWKLSYTVFNGTSDDVNATPTELIFDDTYEDSGTTSKIVHRTTNITASGFIPNYYLGVKIETMVTGSTLSSNAVLISCDLLFSNYINN